MENQAILLLKTADFCWFLLIFADFFAQFHTPESITTKEETCHVSYENFKSVTIYIFTFTFILIMKIRQ